MAWRLQLTDRTIQHLEILDGNPRLLAAWARRDRVAYYNLETGVMVSEAVHQPPTSLNDRTGLEWQSFLSTLVAPNAATLTLLRLPQGVVRLSHTSRLFRIGATELYLQDDDGETRLATGSAQSFMALDMAQVTGVIVTLDELGRLYRYDNHIEPTIHDLNLSPDGALRPLVVISDDGTKSIVTNRRDILHVDAQGTIKSHITTPYTIGRIAISAGGTWLIVSDRDTGVLRIYDVATLSQSYQRFAVDLLSQATQLQLIADFPPVSAALSSIAIADDGLLTFAMSGVMCVSHTDEMIALPGVTVSARQPLPPTTSDFDRLAAENPAEFDATDTTNRLNGAASAAEGSAGV